jgi:hypothetical protein
MTTILNQISMTNLLFQKGNSSDALDRLNSEINDHNNLSSLYLNRGAIFGYQKNVSYAINDFKKAI